MERETGIEPATFSLGSGIGFMFSETYPAFFDVHEPVEPAIRKDGKNLDQIWTKPTHQAELQQIGRIATSNYLACFDCLRLLRI